MTPIPWPHPIIAREGWPFVAGSVLLAVAVWLTFGAAASVAFWVIAVFVLQFFRDPPRQAPVGERVVLSPADGRIVKVVQAHDPHADRPALLISVFMNVFNVHSNRVSVGGTVRQVDYFPGSFVNADLDKDGDMQLDACQEDCNGNGTADAVEILADMPLDRSTLRGNELDLDALVSPKDLRRFTERDFIFSDSLTYKGELAEELAELDAVKEDKKGAALISTLTQTGGALGLVYASAKALTAIERYFKRQEQKEIQDEIELTGNYISVDAGDVETVFDPSTGKNLTISKAPRAKANITATELAAPTGTLAKVLGFLGLGGAPAADDDGFWSAPQPTFKGPKKGGDGSGSGASSGQEGADGGSDGGDAEGKDGLEDDSSAVDELGDLLGGDAPGKKK